MFVLSAAIAGLAGALFVPQVGHHLARRHGHRPIDRNGDLGGGGRPRRRWSAPIVGALLVNAAQSGLSESFPDVWQYFLGALFIGAVVLFPQGLVGALGKLFQRATDQRTERQATSVPEVPTAAMQRTAEVQS